MNEVLLYLPLISLLWRKKFSIIIGNGLCLMKIKSEKSVMS